ncbi:hypothetical protein B0H13DRAFT_2196560 [Mycena leptocephala]|nr:hypothetical protein B0H13DRAFT_2196560 [Mycena leptocephala]
MADQAEVAFLRVYLNTLGAQPVIYKDDYQQPPENSLKKIPVLQIALPAPPRRSSSSTSTSTSLTLTFKSLKPPAAYTLAVHPTDSIQAVKERLAAQPNGPPVAAQRLLLKGKALADAKLVKEYPLADGDTVNLVLKAIPAPVDKDIAMADATPSAAATAKPPTLTLDPPLATSTGPRRHTRIPSVVLSPSPSSESPAASVNDITLTLDADHDGGLPSEELSAYHVALAEPEFWEKLLAFLSESFPAPADAERAWEDFLRASKGTLTASEVARIRDHVGVVGMAGT